MATSTLLAHSSFLRNPNPNLHPKPSFSLPRLSFHPKPYLPTLKSTPKPFPLLLRSTSISLPFPFPIPTPNLPPITPLSLSKWALLAALAVSATRTLARSLLSPFFWVYFSWTWLYWPWFVSVAAGVSGLVCLRRHIAGLSGIFEQLTILTSSVLWLTLVPPAHFNGYLEGWPVVFFFIYHYFFFFESSVRKRLYGDLEPREHDPKWDVMVPRWLTVTFSVLVMFGHWLAAFEGPELHLVPGGWSNCVVWGLILLVLFVRYHSVLYLAKYSEKVVVPTQVVRFGPYRWVRHPVYTSVILLFVVYCAAMRAPLSLGFLVVIGLFYYGRKAAVEEDLMMDAFGESYAEYKSKVRYKLIPFLY